MIAAGLMEYGVLSIGINADTMQMYEGGKFFQKKCVWYKKNSAFCHYPHFLSEKTFRHHKMRGNREKHFVIDNLVYPLFGWFVVYKTFTRAGDYKTNLRTSLSLPKRQPC